MFSLALNEPNSSRRWKVRPTPSRARVWGRRAVISRPSMLTWPRFGRWNPVTTLNRVVLPAPLGPMRPVTAPALDSSETPPRACTPPKLTLTSSTRNTGRLLHHVGGCGGVRLTWARGPRRTGGWARPRHGPPHGGGSSYGAHGCAGDDEDDGQQREEGARRLRGYPGDVYSSDC